MSRSTSRFLCVALPAALIFAAGICSSIAGQTVKIASKQDRGMAKPDPGAGERWRRLAWMDENGKIPVNGLKRAIEQKEQLANLQPETTGQWAEEGPTNLAGRTCCLAVSPTNPLTMWMGAAGGGVWLSNNGGTTWTPVGDQLASLAVNALTLDPNNSTTLYAGTGEGYYNYDAIGGLGIFKSTDSGSTWSLLPATASFSHVNRIAVDPSNSKIILATIEPGGIYRTADGGSTWKQVLSAQSGQAVVFCPSNTSRIIGSVLNYDSTTSSWSAAAVVSNDTGQTWTTATGGLGSLPGMGRIEPAPLVSNANTIFASATDGNVWESTDGGASYSEITTSSPSDASLTANAIWVDPINSNRIVVGGQNVWESTDAGVTLTIIGSGGIQTTSPHPGIHSIVASPAYDGVTNKTVYVCTNGGVYAAPDITVASAGLGWQPHFLGARISQYYSVCGDAVSGRIFGGLQDNGAQTMEAGLFESTAITPSTVFDCGYVAMDPTNAQNMFGEAGYLQVFQSTNGGFDIQTITSGLDDASTQSCNYIAPLIIDPNNPQVLLAGGASLWRCANADAAVPTWTAIRPPGSAYLSAIAIGPSYSDEIWIGQNDGTVAMTQNGSADSPTWTTVCGPQTSSPVPNRYVSRILVDPQAPTVAYVSLGGFTANNLWETSDSGATWISITGAGSAVLPEVPIHAIARNPEAPSSLYVGTEVGVFSTTDGGQSWTTSSDLKANVSVDELTYMNNSTSLLAATHGRGVWILPGETAAISAFTLNPTSVLGGDSVQATITLSQVAGPAGVTVSLSTDSAEVLPPATVTVPSGFMSIPFSIGTAGVSGPQTVTVLATLGSSQKSATLAVTPAVLSSLSLAPLILVGGNSSFGTVKMSGLAPVGGVIINLSTSFGDATAPNTVTIAGGANSAQFTIATSGVSKVMPVSITATEGATSLTQTLMLEPAALASIAISPSSIVGGNATTGTVTLSGDATIGGTTVKLISNSKAGTVPASVTVASGSSSATFSIATSVVAAATTVAVTATQGGTTHTADLIVDPTSLQSVVVAPSTVVGGSTTAVTGVVALSGPAPGSGQIVTLGSSNSKVVSLPSSVRVAAGSTRATFVLTALSVSSSQAVTITGALGKLKQSAALSVVPFQVAGVSVSPSSVPGGAGAAGLVTLNASPGPHGGAITVKLSSTATAARTPTSVVVPVGSSSGHFNITTSPVASPTLATVSAALGGSSQQTTLTVKPPSLLSLTLKPTSVVGRAATVVTGTVTLTSPAAAGGLVVLLSSSAPAASVPAGLTIPSGKTSATFAVRHSAVSSHVSVLLTASLNTVSKTAALVVTP